MAVQIVDERKDAEKWIKRCLESIEDYQCLMSNPQWMTEDRVTETSKIMSRLQARLTQLARLNK